MAARVVERKLMLPKRGDATAGGARGPWPLAALALGALGAIVYGPHVVHGGFAWDDWANAATSALHVAPHFLGPFNLREAAYEPGIALALPLPHLVLGLNAGAQLALAVALGVGLSLALIALLRELGVPWAAAALAGALALLFPWSDANRLWATAGLNQIAAILYLAGATLALRGLRVDGPLATRPPAGDPAANRSVRRLRRASLALYLVSMLTYAVAIPAVALSSLLYRLRVPWRVAWRRGRWDALVALAVAVYVEATTTKPTQPFGGQLHHALRIADQWLTLLAHAILPLSGLPRGVALAAIGAALLAGTLAVRGCARRDKTEHALALRRSLALALGGAFFSLLAYALFVPGDPKYQPLAPGLYNRVGLLAGPGLAVLAIGLIGLVAEGLAAQSRRVAAGSSRQSRRVATGSSVVLACALLASWASLVREHAATWDAAARQSRGLLSAVARDLPTLPHGSTIYTVGQRPYQAPGVPVFASTFDLSSAIEVTRHDASLGAAPLDSPLACGAATAAPSQRTPYRPLPPAPYGRLFVVDVASGRLWQVNSRAQCRRAMAARPR